MKYWRLFFVSSVLLTRATSHVNIFPYRALARAATEYTTWTHTVVPYVPAVEVYWNLPGLYEKLSLTVQEAQLHKFLRSGLGPPREVREN